MSTVNDHGVLPWQINFEFVGGTNSNHQSICAFFFDLKTIASIELPVIIAAEEEEYIASRAQTVHYVAANLHRLVTLEIEEHAGSLTSWHIELKYTFNPTLTYPANVLARTV